MPIWIDISSVQALISELHWIKCANSNNWRYSTSFKSRDNPWTKFPNNFKTWNGKKSNSIKLEPSLTCLERNFKNFILYYTVISYDSYDMTHISADLTQKLKHPFWYIIFFAFKDQMNQIVSKMNTSIVMSALKEGSTDNACKTIR